MSDFGSDLAQFRFKCDQTGHCRLLEILERTSSPFGFAENKKSDNYSD